MSLATLSQLVYYSKGHLSKIENGARFPSADLARCCDVAFDADGALARLAADRPLIRRQAAMRATGPSQLPAGVAHFVGRSAAVDRLDAVLARGGPPGTVMITTIDGTAGVGKTALALHWCHRVKDRFPHGTLFADLRGYDPANAPADPGDVLNGFLRALGVAPETLCSSLDWRSALLRSLLDGKRMLVVLDNAATSEQIRPLLPGSQGCMVVATSRRRLSGLVARDGAVRVTLDPLPGAEALQLLRQTLSRPRVQAEPAAAARIAHRCAYLPLALRIAADRAAARPQLKLADLADQLAGGADRLDLLAVADDKVTAMRAVFSWSYQSLPTGPARLFRLTALHPGPEMSAHAAAALIARPVTDSRRLLDELADAHLLKESGPARYRCHDLLRAYAAERAQHDETETDRSAAVMRVLCWYLHTADAADRVLFPQRRHVDLCCRPPVPPLAFARYADALAWCEAERTNLVDATRRAAEAGHDAGWRLPIALAGFFMLCKHWTDWIASCQLGLQSARRLNDPYGESWVLASLGAAYGDLRRFEDAVGCFRQAPER